jgi:hypothetical protein
MYMHMLYVYVPAGLGLRGMAAINGTLTSEHGEGQW